MKIRLIFFHFFFTCCLHAELSDQADAYFRATLFDEAIPLYEKLLLEQENSLWRIRLAQAYYAADRHTDLIQLLENDASDPESLYYLGLAYKHTSQPQKALVCFAASAKLQHPSALIEQGICEALDGNLAQAEQILMPEVPKHPLATLYLVRIKLSQGKLSEADRYLSLVSPPQQKQDPLWAEFDSIKKLLAQAVESQKRDALHWLQKGTAEGDEKGKALLAALPKEGDHVPECLFLLASYYQSKKDFSNAETLFVSVAEKYPQSTQAPEAWFRASECAEKEQKNPQTIFNYRRQVYDRYPESPFAPEAYFNCYSYQDYLQGGRSAVKHLQAMPTRFPQSPLILSALYLTALDERRDRKSPEGRWVRKKNLNNAIATFHEIETKHEELLKQGLIPKEDEVYYLQLKYRATLERALNNLAVAEESIGAKKQIFQDYAKEVLAQFKHELQQTPGFFSEPLPPIYEEALYWQGITYTKSQQDPEAEQVFDELLAKYRELNVQRGYYLSRTWYEKGMIALRQKKYDLALQDLSYAEEASKGKVLNADQKLDLWIQQSYCYRCLNQFDQAMLILSKVINENVISSLRVKAMFLRAELYEMQGRRELARRQLESVSKKGGDWALKAKEKLEREYNQEYNHE